MILQFGSYPNYIFKNIGVYCLYFALIIYLTGFTDRHETWALLSSFSLLFACYLFLVMRLPKDQIDRVDTFFKYAIITALCFTTPALSDDIYRFIWDGRLLAAGLEPYLMTPVEVVETIPDLASFGLDEKLYQSLNSPDYYTVYPPIMQGVFGLTAWISGEQIFLHTILIKIILSGAIIGTWHYLQKICEILLLPRRTSLLFILNPLVLIEVIGNTHFEGLQLLFIAIATYWILAGKHIWGGIFWGLAAAVKLLPLMLVPVVSAYLGFRRGWIFALVAGTVFASTFLPFLSVDLVHNIASSIDLYFRSFEFNASIYYLLREVGYYIKGYNMIAYLGPVLSILFLMIYSVLIAKQTISNKNQMLSTMLWGLILYFIFATTVHPWYLITPLFFAVLLGQWHTIIWSGLIFLSYAAYQINGVEENQILIWIEYTIVLLMMIYHKRIALFVDRRLYNRQKNKKK